MWVALRQGSEKRLAILGKGSGPSARGAQRHELLSGDLNLAAAGDDLADDNAVRARLLKGGDP